MRSLNFCVIIELKEVIFLLKVVFYSRVSTDEEKQLNALDKQIQELADYIHSQKDWVLVDKYIDEGISGTTSKGRHEYNRLYNDLLTDKFDIVVIKDQSRLMRNVLDWYLFLDRVMKNGKQIFMYLDNSFYTPDNAFISGIKAMMAEEYSRDLSRKIKSAAQRSQRNGTVYGNNRMLGYKQEGGKLTIIEEEAEIVRKVFEWYIQGNGFRVIQQKLLDKGIMSTTGTPFSLSTLKRMIKQEKYKGLLISGKRRKNFETKQMVNVPESEWVVIPNGVPAIVSEEIWEKANQCLRERCVENGIEYANIDEMNRTTTMRDDERDGRSYLPGGESRVYDDGRYKTSREDSRHEGMRNYRFKHKYKDEYDTEIEEEIYKVVESKPEEEQGETVEKIINVLAEPINDMKITYPRIYDKVINKIKVMKQ